MTRSLRFCTQIDYIVRVLGDLARKVGEILHFEAISSAGSGHPCHKVGPILHRFENTLAFVAGHRRDSRPGDVTSFLESAFAEMTEL